MTKIKIKNLYDKEKEFIKTKMGNFTLEIGKKDR